MSLKQIEDQIVMLKNFFKIELILNFKYKQNLFAQL